jgi:carboxymethylenebutenolidase
MGNMITISFDDQKIEAYEAKPTGEVLGGLIVIHEVWGLVGHTKDLAERYAKEGYHVIAPSLLFETAMTEQIAAPLQEELFDPKRRTQAQPKLRELMSPMQAPDFGAKTLARVKGVFDYLYNQPDVAGKVAITGFCFGGSYSFSLAVHEPRLKAAIPFYGHADFSVEELSKIKCPILAFYGRKDEGLIASLPALEDNMKQAGVNFTDKVYEDTGHAFFNDTNPFAYNKDAATDAWQKSLEFLKENI